MTPIDQKAISNYPVISKGAMRYPRYSPRLFALSVLTIRSCVAPPELQLIRLQYISVQQLSKSGIALLVPIILRFNELSPKLESLSRFLRPDVLLLRRYKRSHLHSIRRTQDVEIGFEVDCVVVHGARKSAVDCIS